MLDNVTSAGIFRMGDRELMYSKNTFRQGVCNDGGSHVETSLICVVPLLWALYRLVASSITWGSQAQPLFLFQKRAGERDFHLLVGTLLFCEVNSHLF